jgi:CRP/FNR family transcriptional regulator, cyclic AMP receptor protein
MLSAKMVDAEPNGYAGNLSCDFPIELQAKKNERCREFYPRGSVLFVEGEPATGIYLLREGRVKVSIASAEGKKLVLRIAQPGDLLGMNATLCGRPYAATAETLDRCRLHFVPRGELFKSLDEDQRGYLGVARALSRKLNSVVDHTRLLFLSQSSAEKLARLLLKWCDEHGKQTVTGIRIDSRLTHEEMAQMICASRETVTRVLSEFKRKRIIKLVDSTIFVHNRKALEAVARC